MKVVPNRHLLHLSTYALLMLSGFGLSACGASGVSESSGTTQATTTTEQPSAALLSYADFWPTYLSAANPMNPLDPRLDAVATGVERKSIAESFLALQRRKIILKGEITTDPVLVSSDGTTATIKDCTQDKGHQFSSETGEQIENSAETFALITVSMVKIDGLWKVSDVHDEGAACEQSAS